MTRFHRWLEGRLRVPESSVRGPAVPSELLRGAGLAPQESGPEAAGPGGAGPGAGGFGGGEGCGGGGFLFCGFPYPQKNQETKPLGSPEEPP